MAARVRIDFQSDGFQALVNSSEVRELVTQGAERIASAAGEGFEASTFEGSLGGSSRPMGMVVSATRAARRAEAENQALTRAVRNGA